MESKNCTIVGGGISGLTSAYELTKRGYKITLLEKQSYIGGRSYPFIKDGFRVDAGAQLIGADYRYTLKLINNIGLKDDLIEVSEPTGAMFTKKGVYLLNLRGMMRYGRLNLRDKWGLFRMLLKIKKIGNQNQFSFTNIENENLFDSISIADWTNENFNENLLEYFVQPSLTAMTLAEPEELSALYGLLVLYSDLKSSYSLKNGTSQLTSALTNRLKGQGVDIKTGCEVTRIVLENDSKFGIEYHQNTEIKHIKTSNVICATPAPITSELIPSLSKNSKKALSKVKYSRGLQVLLGLKKRMWDKSWGILIPRKELEGIALVSESTFKCKTFAPKGKGVFEIFIHGSKAETLYNKDKEKIFTFVIDKMEEVFPQITRDIEWFDILKWNSVMQIHSPNFSKLRREFQTQINGLAFAGDYLYLPSLESAVYSGINASESIAKTTTPNSIIN
jgi:oxygen-dependent protoporphyrinogen oxidase